MTHEEKRKAAMSAYVRANGGASGDEFCRLMSEMTRGEVAAFNAAFDAGTQSWQVADAESDAEYERIKAMPIEDVEKELRDAGVDVELFAKATKALVKACTERNEALRQVETLKAQLAQRA